METVIYIILGIIVGIVIGWLIANSKKIAGVQSEKDNAQQKYNELDKEFVAHKATSFSELQSAKQDIIDLQKEKIALEENIKEKANELTAANGQLATSNANLAASNQTIFDKNAEIEVYKKDEIVLKAETSLKNSELATSNANLVAANETLIERNTELAEVKAEHKTLKNSSNTANQDLATSRATFTATNNNLIKKSEDFEALREELNLVKIDLNEKNQQLATSKASNIALNHNLETQKKEIEELGKKFNLEFENIANKILETKSEKFTELNKNNLKTLLEPLGQNIDEFKKQVNEVYKTESNERFSLGERVKELAILNQVISEEAKNLTKALKGEAKTQGNWGEMILESILERSGLRKNEQYFMEHELKDENGNAILSDSEGKKMRPDAVIKYPDNRNVILDSKVSLNAFTRLIASVDVLEQKKELDSHIAAVKMHIVALSTKGYDDYDKALDFVMMFIPSEPAYIAALQGDPDLWNFAYDKRILLISPTNLITSLKLIVDLWKREYQNQNAIEIAERGAKLYDKFVGFVTNLDAVGKSIDRAQSSYKDAFKQLSTGNDNLVDQATKMKKLGLKPKKELPPEMVKAATVLELDEINTEE
ncbi:MAG: DNA recombination protein RmuC [Bacteroidota bacterium]